LDSTPSGKADNVSASLDTSNSRIHFVFGDNNKSYIAANIFADGTFSHPYSAQSLSTYNQSAEPAICCITSDGYPFTSFTRTSYLWNRWGYFIISSTKDGTWTSDDIYTAFLGLYESGYFLIAYPTSSGIKAYWRTGTNYDGVMRTKQWDGFDWGTTYNSYAHYPDYRGCIGMNTPGGTFFCYTKEGKLYHYVSPTSTYIASGYNTSPQARYCSLNNRMYVFWASGASVYSRSYGFTSHTWDSEATLIYQDNSIVSTSPVYVAFQPDTSNVLIVWLRANGSKYDLVCNRTSVVPGAFDSRVHSIRHQYRPGVYKMQLGFGKLSSLPDYKNNLDKLRVKMRKEATEEALTMMRNEYDLLTNHPAEDMSPNPLLQDLWKQGK
jgi:hypothetical protein